MFADDKQNKNDDFLNAVSLPSTGQPQRPQPPGQPPADSAPVTNSQGNLNVPHGANAKQPTDSELLEIKKQALGQLSPLVAHLEQSPEEKFRTTMMMIQASDNKDLIKDAYAAAQAITDDRTKAQALLDIINEINYFAQKDQSS